MNEEPSSGAPAAGPGAAAIVLRQSRLQRDGIFGALTAAFLVALVRGYAGAQTAAGRVAVVLFVFVVAGTLVLGWVRVIRHPSRLEISSQAITLVDGRGARRTLSRSAGGQLRVVRVGGGRYAQPGLTVPGSGTVIPLGFFSTREVRRQCSAAGWSFAGRR